MDEKMYIFAEKYKNGQFSVFVSCWWHHFEIYLENIQTQISQEPWELFQNLQR